MLDTFTADAPLATTDSQPRRTWLLAGVVALVALVTPTQAAPQPAPRGHMRAAADDLRAVQEVIGKVMKLKPQFVSPDARLIDLQMTTLDYADTLEMLETKLNITISKRELLKAAGITEQYEVVEKLTVKKLAEFVNTLPTNK